MAKRVRYPADVKAKLQEIAVNAAGKKPKEGFEDATAAGYNGNENAWQNYEASDSDEAFARPAQSESARNGWFYGSGLRRKRSNTAERSCGLRFFLVATPDIP